VRACAFIAILNGYFGQFAGRDLGCPRQTNRRTDRHQQLSHDFSAKSAFIRAWRIKRRPTATRVSRVRKKISVV
jgi:hypothetical protein